MLIRDALYGEFEIDGVLEELILSKPVQRLKDRQSMRSCQKAAPFL